MTAQSVKPVSSAIGPVPPKPGRFFFFEKKAAKNFYFPRHERRLAEDAKAQKFSGLF
jgi:hypothetical protein